MKYMNVLLAAVFVISASTSAQAGDDNLSIGGNVWANFKYDQKTKNNGFDVERSSFKVGYKFNDKWSVNTTTDLFRAGHLFVHVKQAYVKGPGLMDGGMMTFGLQPTPYIDSTYAVTKSRWLAKSLSDTLSYLNSEEAGAWFEHSFLDKALNVNLGLHNGTEGTNNAALTDNNLGVSLTVNYKMSDLSITIDETILTGKGTSNIVSANVAYDHAMIKVAPEFTIQMKDSVNSMAFGGTVNVAATDDIGVFANFYTGDTNGQAALGSKYTMAAGPTYTFAKDKVHTALLYGMKTPVIGDATWDLTWKWAANF